MYLPRPWAFFIRYHTIIIIIAVLFFSENQCFSGEVLSCQIEEISGKKVVLLYRSTRPQSKRWGTSTRYLVAMSVRSLTTYGSPPNFSLFLPKSPVSKKQLPVSSLLKYGVPRHTPARRRSTDICTQENVRGYFAFNYIVPCVEQPRKTLIQRKSLVLWGHYVSWNQSERGDLGPFTAL